MTKRQYSDLLLIIILTILAVVFIKTPGLRKTFVWNILGILLIVIIPGYSLIAALFPKKTNLDGIERAALSFGLSVAIAPLFFFVMKYAHWKVRLTHLFWVPPSFTLYMALSAFTLIMVFIALIRRWRTDEENRFSVSFSLKPVREHFRGESRTSKILSIILIISIILAVGTTVYIIVKPHQGEKFTEFYILGENGKASDYPTNMTAGETGNVTIGIVNHEYRTVDYTLVVESNNTTLMQQNVTLDSGAKVEIPYNFTVGSAGQKEIKFLLYKLPDNETSYRDLHLWVTVS
jgi:uncharacterized membrane protein